MELKIKADRLKEAVITIDGKRVELESFTVEMMAVAHDLLFRIGMALPTTVLYRVVKERGAILATIKSDSGVDTCLGDLFETTDEVLLLAKEVLRDNPSKFFEFMFNIPYHADVAEVCERVTQILRSNPKFSDIAQICEF